MNSSKIRQEIRMAGSVLAITAVCLAVLLGACGRRGGEKEHSPQENQNDREEITIMHVDAGKPEFEAFIKRAEEQLKLRIHVLSYPDNADSRHAKVSSLLASGDSSVDIFAVNDEMISEFKYAGYLEPLQDDVMNEETASAYPQEYLKQMIMAGDEIYSAPYMMDILALWVNEEWLKEIGLPDLSTEERFLTFLTHDWGEGRYAYGGAWEKTYIYNELGVFICLFGGDYYDWGNENTRKAVRFLKECVDKGYTSREQLIDQYEQLNQKFIDGKYGMVFMYVGTMNTYKRAGVYGENQIHMTALPNMGGNATYMATWQYALNKASRHKEAAKRFIRYAIGKEGCRYYGESLDYMPAREDLIWEEELNVTGFHQMREYMKNVRLIARPIPENSMEYISLVGETFQDYVTGKIDLETYCTKMQQLVTP